MSRLSAKQNSRWEINNIYQTALRKGLIPNFFEDDFFRLISIRYFNGRSPFVARGGVIYSSLNVVNNRGQWGVFTSNVELEVWPAAFVPGREDAELSPIFGLSPESIKITGGDVDLNGTYLYVYPSQEDYDINRYAAIYKLQVYTQGIPGTQQVETIRKPILLNTGYNFKSMSDVVISIAKRRFYDDDPPIPTVEVVEDKYLIVDIHFDNPGFGYRVSRGPKPGLWEYEYDVSTNEDSPVGPILWSTVGSETYYPRKYFHHDPRRFRTGFARGSQYFTDPDQSYPRKDSRKIIYSPTNSDKFQTELGSLFSFPAKIINCYGPEGKPEQSQASNYTFDVNSKKWIAQEGIFESSNAEDDFNPKTTQENGISIITIPSLASLPILGLFKAANTKGKKPNMKFNFSRHEEAYKQFRKVMLSTIDEFIDFILKNEPEIIEDYIANTASKVNGVRQFGKRLNARLTRLLRSYPDDTVDYIRKQLFVDGDLNHPLEPHGYRFLPRSARKGFFDENRSFARWQSDKIVNTRISAVQYSELMKRMANAVRNVFVERIWNGYEDVFVDNNFNDNSRKSVLVKTLSKWFRTNTIRKVPISAKSTAFAKYNRILSVISAGLRSSSAAKLDKKNKKFPKNVGKIFGFMIVINFLTDLFSSKAWSACIFDAFSPITTDDIQELQDELDTSLLLEGEIPEEYISAAEFSDELEFVVNQYIQSKNNALLETEPQRDNYFRSRMFNLLEAKRYLRTYKIPEGTDPKYIRTDSNNNQYVLVDFGEQDKIPFIEKFLQALKDAQEDPNNPVNSWYDADTISKLDSFIKDLRITDQYLENLSISEYEKFLELTTSFDDTRQNDPIYVETYMQQIGDLFKSNFFSGIDEEDLTAEPLEDNAINALDGLLNVDISFLNIDPSIIPESLSNPEDNAFEELNLFINR